ncbi:hypothetical protein VUR80DRAFT_482 [Thermomyces stellatus]
MKLATIFAFLGLAGAMPSRAGLNSRDGTKRRLLIGGPEKILAADFDGSTFSVVGSASQSEALFSWLLFRDGSDVVYAVDELSNKLHVYKYNPDGGEQMFELQQSAEGASGVVHLELNEDGTRMVASAYGSDVIQVWDTSEVNSIKLVGNVTDGIPEGVTSGSMPHQAVRHPTKPFFVVNNLGTDAIFVIDARDDDNYRVANTVFVEEGCGPRHGVFSTLEGSDYATFYTVVCEKSNKLLEYKLEYTDDNINFEILSSTSTFGPAPPEPPGPDAAAGAIAMISNDIYVSNRLTGHEEDSISHFSSFGDEVHFEAAFSSKANNPRMVSISEDGQFIYVANVENSQGLHAFRRNTDNGMVNDEEAVHADLSGHLEDDAEASGPYFVLEIAAN